VGFLIILAGFSLLLSHYFISTPVNWFYLGWLGVIIGALIIYIDWRRGYG